MDLPSDRGLDGWDRSRFSLSCPLDQNPRLLATGCRLHWLGRPDLASRGLPHLTGLPRVLGPASGLSPHYHLHPHLPSPQEPRDTSSAVLAWSSTRRSHLPSNLEPPLANLRFSTSWDLFEFSHAPPPIDGLPRPLLISRPCLVGSWECCCLLGATCLPEHGFGS